jgi:purine-cytosine permease-like protein
VQLLIGNLLPLVVMIIFANTKSSVFETFLVTLFYLTNPMFTFYLANYQIVINYLNSQTKDKDPIVIPLVGGLHASFGFSVGCFMLQFVLYMSLVMYRD